MTALLLLLLTADPPPAPDAPVSEQPAEVQPSPTLNSKLKVLEPPLSKAWTFTQTEVVHPRPSVKMSALLLAGGVASIVLGAFLLVDAWGYGKLATPGAWTNESVRYLTASGAGYTLSGVTVSITAVVLLVRTLAERRAWDARLEAPDVIHPNP